jgi:23S rRNA pseudouridine1911/1915/1917 synthase
MVVHPAPGNPNRTLVNALIAHCGASLSGIGGVRRPGIVHRLDKDTSGLIVAAKCDAAHRGLVRQFAAREVERAYRALVWGTPLPRQGEVRGNIGRSPRNRKKMAVLGRGGRPALTRYRMLRAFADAASLLDCRLATGRTHQIRVHLAYLGHPVIGDKLYGRARTGRRATLPEAARTVLSSFERQALHACLLGFRHPLSDQSLRFESELPFDINQLISMLETL